MTSCSSSTACSTVSPRTSPARRRARATPSGCAISSLTNEFKGESCLTNGHYSRRSGPRDRQFRVGDAEREAVADILRREHLAGRLDNDEFDERVARCLAAKTYAELDELIGDFPGDEREARRVAGSWGWRPWPVPLSSCRSLVAAIVFSHGRAAWLWCRSSSGSSCGRCSGAAPAGARSARAPTAGAAGHTGRARRARSTPDGKEERVT